MTLFLLMRSTNAPAKGVRKTVGTKFSPTTSAISDALPVISYMIHE